MERDYKKLFQKILPKITYSYNESDDIVYEIEYKNVMITDKTLSILVDYKLIRPKNKLTITPRLLNETLRCEIKSISRYLNMDKKIVTIVNANR